MPYMMVDERYLKQYMMCFIDTNINAFRIKDTLQEEKEQPTPIEIEAKSPMDQNNLFSIYFDGASSKEGSSARVLFISPNEKMFNFSSTLSFTCTNNVVEYEALLLGLRLAEKHGIKNLKVIGDSELVISQVRSKYASKNKRLKKYINVVWDEIEKFDAFNIDWKERNHNRMVRLLANISLR